MSFSHLVIFAVILIIFVPPEKLPEVMRNIARFFNQLRGASSGLWDELKREAAVKPEDLYQYKAQPAPKNSVSVNQQPAPSTTTETNATHENTTSEINIHSTVSEISNKGTGDSNGSN